MQTSLDPSVQNGVVRIMRGLRFKKFRITVSNTNLAVAEVRGVTFARASAQLSGLYGRAEKPPLSFLEDRFRVWDHRHGKITLRAPHVRQRKRQVITFAAKPVIAR